MAKKRNIELQQFVNGTSGRYTLKTTSTNLGYSPALESASMARNPTVRDENRRERKNAKQQLRRGDW